MPFWSSLGTFGARWAGSIAKIPPKVMIYAVYGFSISQQRLKVGTHGPQSAFWVPLRGQLALFLGLLGALKDVKLYQKH